MITDPSTREARSLVEVEIVQHAGENSGVRFEGQDLLPSNGPHKVPRWFAEELIGGNRARKVTPDDEIENDDPSPENADPKPRKKK
jgi:hypothetical protein